MAIGASTEKYFLCKPSQGHRKALLLCYQPSKLSVDCGFLYSGSMSHPELASILGSLDITPKVFQSINGLRNHYAQHILEGCRKLDVDLANARDFIEIADSRIGSCYCFLLGEYYQRKAKSIQDEQSDAALLDYQADVLEYQAAARMTTWVDDYWAYVGDDVDRDSLNIPPDDADEF